MSFLRIASPFAPAAALLVTTLAALSGCAEPTMYRYTGLVPAARPLAWDGRTAPDGSLRLEGSISRSDVQENLFPVEHDTALRVTSTMVEGSASIAVTPAFEMGFRFAYGDYAWSQKSAVGTLPLPAHPSSTGWGPELRGTIPFDRDHVFTLGIAANAMSYTTPYAEWIKTGEGSPRGYEAPCTPSRTCVEGFTLFGENSESHFAASLGLYPSFAFGQNAKYGHAFLLLGGHTGYKNDGFTNKVQNGSTIESAGLVGIVGAGYGISISPIRASAMIFKQLDGTGAPVAYLGGAMLTLGVDIELWESKAKRREQRRREKEEREERLRTQTLIPQGSPQDAGEK